MVKITLPNIEKITIDFPDIDFVESENFYWSARDNCVYFNNNALKNSLGLYRLLHEIGHALCQHKGFGSGVQLLRMETEAWAKARQLAKQYSLVIDENHVEKCLDSYRDWLHARSVCPNCQTLGVETDDNQYRCLSCTQKWQTPVDQRTRCYRKKITS